MARFRVVSPLATAGTDEADPEPLTLAYGGRSLQVALGEEFDLPDWLPLEAIEGQGEHYLLLDAPKTKPSKTDAPGPAVPAADATTTTVEE